ncbi:MAG: hypothetical protein L0Y61_06480, partial [Epsilonproteobacteria bacterium]|nr:hypothetical protein [Campylobacterota bacterium]
MNNKLLLSAVASGLLLQNLATAQTVNIRTGWNLVGVQEKSMSSTGEWDIATLVKTYPQIQKITNVTNTYTAGATRNSLTKLSVGKGYWVKATADVNVTLNGTPLSNDEVSLSAGWNLTSFNSNIGSIDSIKSYISSKQKIDGIKIDVITNVTNTFNINSARNSLTSVNSNSGYWVKVQKLAGTVQTADGLDVELYVDREGQDLSTLKTTIKDKNATELATSLDYSKVSSVIISKTVDGQKYSSSQVDPKSNFADTLKNILTNTLDDKKIKENRATSGASLYVYSVSEGGSPSIIADAEVYKVETNGSIGDLIGSTSSTGFIYLASLPTSGKVYISKNKYDSTVQTISSNGNANYIFLSEDDGTGEIALDGDFSTDDKTSGRVLSRLSEATVEKTYTSSAGGIYLPLGGVAVDGSFVKVKSADWSVLPDYSSIKTKFDEVGYTISPLGKISVSAKTAKSEYNFGQSWSDVISYTGNYAENVNKILGLLGVTLTADMLAEVTDDDTNKTTKDLLDKLKGVDK